MVHSGEKRFREGAIDSITMENWMAYTGPVRLKALPGVNIIAAANGCGKSAIVCAIAIGLGFDPSVLSRGDNIRAFIKRGCKKSKLQIGLIDRTSPNGVTLITRNMTIVASSSSSKSTDRDAGLDDVDEELEEEALPGLDYDDLFEEPAENAKRKNEDDDEDYDVKKPQRNGRQKSKKRKAAKDKAVSVPSVPVTSPTPPKQSAWVRTEWLINGRSATLEMVKQLQKRLNIQVNNLLTFLAQANVGKFASLSPQNLLRSTLNAIEPSLCDDLESIIDMSKDVKLQRSTMQMLIDDLNATTMKITQLKVINETLSQLKDATLYANLVKQKLYRIKLSNLEKGCKATKTKFTSTGTHYQRLKEDKLMMDHKLKSLTLQHDKLIRQVRAKIVKAKGLKILESVKPVKGADVEVVPLSDNNIIDKVFYKALTELRTFTANKTAKSGLVSSGESNRGVLEERLAAVNKQIELLKMQIAGEHELTGEIAECRMQEEALKSKLHALQKTAIRKYDDIQVENLLQKLNSIKRDGYRRFIRWRRERLTLQLSDSSESQDKDQRSHPSENRDSNESQGDSAVSAPVKDQPQKVSMGKMPKLLVSDVKVCGRTNCCIIEETASRYLDCLLVTRDSSISLSEVLSKFKVPTLTEPETPPVLCKVTDRMRSFGVKLFLHEIVECSDPATKSALASVAHLGTSFVVDEKVLRGRLECELLQLSSQSSQDNSSSQSVDLEPRCAILSDEDVKKIPDVGSSVTSKNGRFAPIGSPLDDLVVEPEPNELKVTKNVRIRGNPRGQPRDTGVGRSSRSLVDPDPHQLRLRKEEEYFRTFYDCMKDEIGKQLCQRVRVLRYYLGTSRHIYREFRDTSELYSDYSVDIPISPSILHDASNSVKVDNTSQISTIQKELDDLSDKIKVLSGMLYGRKQDNKMVAGRLYALSREQHSLEKTLQNIGVSVGVVSAKNKDQIEFEQMERGHKEQILDALSRRTDTIMSWIDKAKWRRTTVNDAQELYSRYKKVNDRKIRLYDICSRTTSTFETVESEYKRLEGTLSEQECKRKSYQRDITELNILIKAISGEIVRSTSAEDKPESACERDALRIRQEKSIRLDQMTEGDLERELQLAEIEVKRLERDDCEEAQNAKLMRDAIIHEQKLSTELAEAESTIVELDEKRVQLYDRWIARVSSIISHVDTNFGRYMREIGDGSGGQIRFDAPLDNISDAKVLVLVKFHRDRDLLPLCASYQSGGERCVTTMVYILAVQHLTTNAFFVIDEINQGLDSNYEKRLMALLLNNRVSSDSNDNSVDLCPRESAPPQYFVITPQLLRGIDLKPATMHFPLNGPGVLNGMVL
ncbi:Structural maintenance of chromosomes protein 5 [Babesia sp. Xinjiang]|uniref:Structural maintenance of chromosomes protein 5 n=1 Tax=Babesia sp. Xinjiang TaxID=462227 RepID=UPI000A24BD2D|nr:Structural maintenance of chromosomes protein 5 [Babesia sp. Xinjiang]ORM41484.1 Structural maintenance of chromosomes protein 5 [Babesia sp. Xinjiang]